MRLLILYFSGTGNTDYVAHYVAERLARPGVDVMVRPIEAQAPGELPGHDLLVAGFPVYACDAPGLFQEYVASLPPGEGRGAFAFCTKGAYAGNAVTRNLARLAARGYRPLGGAAIGMPGTDGLSMVGKHSWLARTALEKDYDHLDAADALVEEIAMAVDAALAASSRRPVAGEQDTARLRSEPGLADRMWAWAYRVSERWALDRFHADASCSGCGLCVRICPTANIELQDGCAFFGDACALCLRCLHACPEEAIQIGRLTVGKFRWKGPKGDYRPPRLR
jgi:ferredoxin